MSAEGSPRRPAQHTAGTVVRWLEEGRRVAAGLLVGIDGSAPLDVGASMYVDAEGTIEGSVTGGCVESAVAQEAMELLASGGPGRLITYGISDDLAGTVGLMCGGTVHIFIHELTNAAREATLRGLEALVDDHPHAVATLLDGEHAGSKLYVDADGQTGSLAVSKLLDDNVAREARGLIAHAQSVVRRFGDDGATLAADLRVNVTVHADPPRMVIFGAIDFSAALASMAGGMGYHVTIADPRTAFLASARFSAAAETVAKWPDEVIATTPLGPRDAVLVFTHDAKFDVPALMAAFGTEAGYIGALGSRRTTVDREERLREAGATDADLARVYAPAGLDIGAATVEETAIAVLAEIIAHRAGRTGAPLRESSGPIRRARQAASLAEGP